MFNNKNEGQAKKPFTYNQYFSFQRVFTSIKKLFADYIMLG